METISAPHGASIKVELYLLDQIAKLGKCKCFACCWNRRREYYDALRFVNR